MKSSIRCSTPEKGASLFHPETWSNRLSGLISVEKQEQEGVLALAVRWPTGVRRHMLLSYCCDDAGFTVSILEADWVTGEFTLVDIGEGISEAAIRLFFFPSVPPSFLLECVAVFEHVLKELGVHTLP